MSTPGSKSDNAVVTSKVNNIWSHVTTLAGSNLTPQVLMVVCHKSTAAMAFYTILFTGLVCMKHLKLNMTSSFDKHDQGVMIHCHHPKVL